MRRLLRFFVLTLYVGLSTFYHAYGQCAATMNAVTNQVVCNGSATAPINFSSAVAGITYKWTVDNPAIGLTASGEGNIPSFTATNNTSAPVTATVTVTPYHTVTYAYIPNSRSNNVTLVNVNTREQITNIPVGVEPFGVAVSPDGNRVYITNRKSNTVSIISTATQTVIETIPVGNAPHGIAVSPDGSKVYVANKDAHTVSVISTNNNSVETVNMGDLTSPWGIVVSPNGSKIYVSLSASDKIAIINTENNEVDPVPIENSQVQPEGMAITSSGDTLYVANKNSNSISAINTLDKTLIKIIPAGDSPRALVLSPNGETLYVSNYGDGSLRVINIPRNRITHNLALFARPYGVSISPDGSTLCVTNTGANSIYFLNTANPNTAGNTSVNVSIEPNAFGNFITDVTCVGTPQTFTITVNPTPDVAAVANQEVCNGSMTAPVNFTGSVDGTVYKWTNSNSAIGLPASGVGDIPVFTAANTTNSAISGTVTVTPYSGKTYAYIANRDDDNVSVIDVSSGKVEETISVGDSPHGTAVTSDGTKVYVANYQSGTISVIDRVNKKVWDITIGGNPYALCISPDNSRVYVTMHNNNIVSVINTADNSVNPTPIIVGDRPRDIVISADGSKVYVGNLGSTTISVINTSTNEVTPIDLGVYPSSLILSADGSKLYVSNPNSNTVSIINTATNSIDPTPIIVGNAPSSMVGSPDGSKIYVANYNSGSVSVISTGTNDITNIELGFVPTSLGVSYDGSKVYIITNASNFIHTLNTADNSIDLNTIKVGNSPNALGNISGLIGCSGTPQTFTYTVKLATIIDITTQPTAQAVCAGSAATFSVGATTNDNSMLTVQWRKDGAIIPGATSDTYTIPAVSAAHQGTYDVVIKGDCGDGVISQSATLTINAQPATPVMSTSGATRFCTGGSVTLSSSETQGNQWYKDGAEIAGATAQSYTATESGSYTVRTTQNGCSSPSAVALAVTVNPLPSVPTIAVSGNTLTSSASTGNQWFLNGAAIQGATNASYEVQEAGPYTVQVTSAEGCTATSSVHNFVPTSIGGPGAWRGEVVTFPNPVQKTLTIKNPKSRKLNMVLYNMQGSKVYQGKVITTEGSIDMQGLPAGLYQVVITDVSTNETIRQGIIKH
jgi:YVTN family beta-propeller protein